MTASDSPLALVVEDSPISSRIACHFLQRAAIDTMAAPTLTAALECIQERLPDIILLDINLPDGNGLDFCRQIKTRAGLSDIPVLFISGAEDVETKVKGFEVGGVDYITKPINGEEFIARVTTHLRLKKAYDRLAELQSERIRRLAASQKALMPQPEQYPEANFAIYNKQVLGAGGDFYDVIPVAAGVYDYVVADAAGHDLGASIWTASLKALLAEYATPLNTPLQILHAANKTLHKLLPENIYFTIIYARLNRKTRQLTIANAGHPPALLADEYEFVQVKQCGDVLGAFPDANFDSQNLLLSKGARFYLYSDGIIELEGERDAGLAGLTEQCELKRRMALGESLDSIVEEMFRRHKVEDDIVLMGVDL